MILNSSHPELEIIEHCAPTLAEQLELELQAASFMDEMEADLFERHTSTPTSSFPSSSDWHQHQHTTYKDSACPECFA